MLEDAGRDMQEPLFDCIRPLLPVGVVVGAARACERRETPKKGKTIPASPAGRLLPPFRHHIDIIEVSLRIPMV